MALLDTVIEGTATIQNTDGNYQKFYPSTKGYLIEDMVDYVIEQGVSTEMIFKDLPQWKYKKWKNGDIEIWRISNDVVQYQTSHSSANGNYYSDEINWNTDNFGIVSIDQVLYSVDRRNNSGLPRADLINSYAQNGRAYLKFIVVANSNNTYKASVNFYIRGTWK